IANGDDEIHRRRAGRGEFVPALRAQIVGGKARLFQLLDGKGIDLTCRRTPRAEAFEAPCAPMTQQFFSHDAAGGIAAAEKEDVVDATLHGPCPYPNRPVM